MDITDVVLLIWTLVTTGTSISCISMLILQSKQLKRLSPQEKDITKYDNIQLPEVDDPRWEHINNSKEDCYGFRGTLFLGDVVCGLANNLYTTKIDNLLAQYPLDEKHMHKYAVAVQKAYRARKAMDSILGIEKPKALEPVKTRGRKQPKQLSSNG